MSESVDASNISAAFASLSNIIFENRELRLSLRLDSYNFLIFGCRFPVSFRKQEIMCERIRFSEKIHELQ